MKYLLRKQRFNQNVTTNYVGLRTQREPGSSVGIVSGYGLVEVRSPAEVKGLFL
jgi:hypothetical protein